VWGGAGEHGILLTWNLGQARKTKRAFPIGNALKLNTGLALLEFHRRHFTTDVCFSQAGFIAHMLYLGTD
jgi:hypothetical protein